LRPIRNFEEFVIEGIIKKQSPDKSRANFLLEESKQNYELLLELIPKLGVEDKTANLFVKSCYDILMELVRAKMLLEGYNASGAGAHEAEVSYLRLIKLNEKEIQFADQMRYFRNGILYYGTILDKEYAKLVIEFTKENYNKIRGMIK
jgi:hypothetical protein